MQLNRVVKEYGNAEERLRVNDKAVSENQVELDKAEQELQKNQQILNERVNAIYRHGRVSFVNVILKTEDYREFIQRFDLLRNIGEQDYQVLETIKHTKAEIEKKRDDLVRAKGEAKSLVKKLASQRAQIESNLKKQQSLLAGLEEEVAKLNRAERRLRIAVAREPETGRGFRSGGFVFPVAGPHSYTSSFGAPRVGHRHQGNDIFALTGTPAVASFSGSVEATNTSGGGKTIYLHGDDGTTYIYMHLNGYAVTGGHVSAGQTIGYVGSTGNARGGSPHLHFEIHPGGGQAVDPYPTLRSAE